MTNRDEFIVWLQQQLTARGWDMAELARRGGITRSQISKVLAGDRRPGPTTCRAVARAFHLSPEEVFHRAGLLPRSTPAARHTDELLYHFAALTEEDQQRLLLIVRAWHDATPSR